MMTPSRLHDTGESFSNRRGHSSQLSISDPSHHVTEAIGTLYGDSDDDSGHEPRRDTRPLSFVSSPYGGEQIQKSPLHQQLSPQPSTTRLREDSSRADERQVTSRTMSNIMDPLGVYGNGGLKNAQTVASQNTSEKGNLPFESFQPPLQPPSPLSPTLSLREVQNESQGASQFPLTNIDNPNDIAQELSNLQALRRMSMDVGNSADPDLIPFQGLSLMAMPSIAPTGEDDEGDISRLLWVPAKVHPELAPDQFKNFLEKRVQSIKRRSGESLLSADGQQPRVDGGGLGRKKSMLSRQVDEKHTESKPSGSEVHDTAAGDWILQKRNSKIGMAYNAPELSFNELVNDPSKIVQRLALDTQRMDGTERPSLDEDKPILPAPTMGLRRSTRTTYRKGGSLRSGDRVPFSKRSAGTRQLKKDTDKEAEQPSNQQPSSDLTFRPVRSLQRANSEPLAPENFSRPVRPPTRRQQPLPRDGVDMGNASTEQPTSPVSEGAPTNTPGLFGSSLSESASSTASNEGLAASLGASTVHLKPTHAFPQRSSSQGGALQDLSQTNASFDIQQQHPDDSFVQKYQAPQPKSSKRPSSGRTTYTNQMLPTLSVTDTALGQTLTDVASQPSVLPGSGSSRTDSLTFIPTLQSDERRTDKKSKDKDEADSGKSMGWKWFKSDDREKKKKEREREREREREKEDTTKKLRPKIERTQSEKAHDSARLDVLQSSIDNPSPKGRESLVIDRESAGGKLPDERKSETSNRKISELKKEKDGFFGSIFGGSRRKESKDGGSSKGKQRVSSPEPVFQLLRPDIDYPYTRFPIVEERAIYRMAHIKLANPRRDLRSQVLLSNFMYSYLAKVQAMHPQLNVPTSPHQKRQEEERRRREEELQQQQYLEQQMLIQQQQHLQGGPDQYDFEYHRSATQYGDSAQRTNSDSSTDYIDDAQIFEYDHGGHESTAAVNIQVQPHQQHQLHQQQAQHTPHEEHAEGYRDDDSSRTTRGYYEYGHNEKGQHEDNMW